MNNTLHLPTIWWLTPISAFIALLFAYIFYRSVMDKDEGTPRMREIAQAVREGAMAPRWDHGAIAQKAPKKKNSRKIEKIRISFLSF